MELGGKGLRWKGNGGEWRIGEGQGSDRWKRNVGYVEEKRTCGKGSGAMQKPTHNQSKFKLKRKREEWECEFNGQCHQ